MLHLSDIPLPILAQNLLDQYQLEVDLESTFAAQVAKAKKAFTSKNKANNGAFRHVRANLTSMSGGTVRCNYCEDSHANQVEHIFPKKFYPDRCFSWINYCYACGPCNQPKSDKFALFVSLTNEELDLKSLPKNTIPPPGAALLIDPRIEDPTRLLYLDTENTFHFVPFSNDSREKRKAQYSIEILGLNSRSYLVRSRRIAFSSFRARLSEYVTKKEAGFDKTILDKLIVDFKEDHHQTVWFEMKRQRTIHSEIDDLLNRAPEALTW